MKVFSIMFLTLSLLFIGGEAFGSSVKHKNNKGTVIYKTTTRGDGVQEHRNPNGTIIYRSETRGDGTTVYRDRNGRVVHKSR